MAQYHDQLAPHEVFQPFSRDKLEQKAALQPTVSAARDRMQEQGAVITGQFFIVNISFCKNVHILLEKIWLPYWKIGIVVSSIIEVSMNKIEL